MSLTNHSQWWRPLPLEVRRWERPIAPVLEELKFPPPGGDVKLGPSIELDKPAGLQGKELEELEKRAAKGPFREERDPPPQIGGWHAWGITKWGKKAGPWGQGPEGLGGRKKE
jgi:protein AFG1